MANTIDYLLRDSEAMLAAITRNQTALTEKGFAEGVFEDLTAARLELKTTELAQQKAVKAAVDKTAEQNEAVHEVTELLKNVRNAAKSAYGEDARTLKLFKIGEKIPDTVKKLCTTTEYMLSVTEEYKIKLLTSGIVQVDIDQLHAAYAKLLASDTGQESAKKLQESATLVRDAAAKAVKAKLKKLRNFVKAAFSKKPELLLQFDPVAKGRGGKGSPDEEGTQPDEPIPPVG